MTLVYLIAFRWHAWRVSVHANGMERAAARLGDSEIIRWTDPVC